MVVPKFVSLAKQGLPITVYGDGAQRRTFCHVTDCVDLMLNVAFGNHGFRRVFNVGNPHNGTTIMDLALRVTRMFDSRAPVMFSPRDVNDFTRELSPDDVVPHEFRYSLRDILEDFR
jgi:nucleoside-diphosphate-sugar epimerase